MVLRQQQAPANVVILDRDGVINQDSSSYIKSVAEWIPIPGSIEAIARLSKAGIRIAIATNQSGIARNYFSENDLAQIHHMVCYMVEALGGKIDGIFYCPHAPDSGCVCRKPATGLLLQIEEKFRCSLVGCYFIGDSEKDLQVATAHGCRPVLVRTGNGIDTELSLLAKIGDNPPVFDDLEQAIDQLFFGRYAL